MAGPVFLRRLSRLSTCRRRRGRAGRPARWFWSWRTPLLVRMRRCRGVVVAVLVDVDARIAEASRFRAAVGVPPGAYPNGRHVLRLAVLW